MVSYQHPSSLSAFRRYRQACAVLKQTSRASNLAWYQDALDLDRQWHIRCEGPVTQSFFFDRTKSQWSAGPSLSDDLLEDPEKRRALIASTLAETIKQGATSLGVIVHIANEFATNEIRPDLDNPAALPEMREAAVLDPGSILDDSSITVEHSTIRLIPYPAAGGETIATAVTHTRQFDPLLADLREAAETSRFPLIAKAVSAPLVALMGLPAIFTPPPEKPFVAILQYPWFTVLSFFNAHADLMLIRTLHHRGTRRSGQLRSALSTTCASLELLDPDLCIIPLGSQVDDSLEASLRATMPQSAVTVVRPSSTFDGVPPHALEPLMASGILAPSADASLSHTFTILRNEGWALQDFLPMPKELSEIYPDRSEMRLLKILRRSRLALVFFALGSVAYILKGLVDVVRKPEWAFDPSQATVTKVLVDKLSVEQQRIFHWNNLLADRSKGWVVMESMARLFRANGGMIAKSFSHSVKPDNTTGQMRVGFVKEWKVTGFARDEALEFLNRLNTRDGINSHFEEIAKVTGNRAFLPEAGNRSITVNVRTLENASFRLSPPDEALITDESTYPFTFDLTITQRFESTDPMAVNVPKAP